MQYHPKAGAGGAISPDTLVTVAAGGGLTFTAAANTGYSVESWYLDGVFAQSGGTSYTLGNITANHTVQVNFTPPNTQAGRGDWWMVHHDPQHTGRSPFTGPAWGGLKWAFTTGAI